MPPGQNHTKLELHNKYQFTFRRTRQSSDISTSLITWDTTTLFPVATDNMIAILHLSQ
jgi:hypothetical protein